MDKIDRLLKNYLESGNTGVSGQRRNAAYPTTDILCAYLADELDERGLERMLAFLRNNPDGQELVSKARELMESEGGWENERVPAGSVDRAKALMRPRGPGGSCPHCGKAITPFKSGRSAARWKNLLWFVLCAASFGLSFAVPRYFYQCLTVALLFGFKGIVELRAAKTQILIYKALSGDETKGHRLHSHSTRL